MQNISTIFMNFRSFFQFHVSLTGSRKVKVGFSALTSFMNRDSFLIHGDHYLENVTLLLHFIRTWKEAFIYDPYF